MQQSKSNTKRSSSFDLHKSTCIQHILGVQDETSTAYDEDEDIYLVLKGAPTAIENQEIRLLTKDELLKIVDGGSYSRDQLAATLIQRKIPFEVRLKIWKRIVVYGNFNYYANRYTCNAKVFNAIKRDVCRSNQESGLSMEKSKYQGFLEHILVAYANYNSQIGYVQGMNIIAGMLIMIMSLEGNDHLLNDVEVIENEIDVFWMFCYIMNEVLDLFQNVKGLISRLETLRKTIEYKIPELIPHLKKIGIVDIQMCFSQYYLVLLMQKMPRKYARMILDMLLLYGENIIHNLIIINLIQNQEKILELDDLSTAMPFFRDLMMMQFSKQVKIWKRERQLVPQFQQFGLFTKHLIHQPPVRQAKQQIQKTTIKERIWNKLFKNQ